MANGRPRLSFSGKALRGLLTIVLFLVVFAAAGGLAVAESDGKDLSPLRAPGVLPSTVAGDAFMPDPPLSLKPDPPPTPITLPFWASNGPLNFGMQVAYSMQFPLPPNASHVDLLYLQPRLGIALRNLKSSPFARLQVVNEGMLGGAVHPGGRILGYTLLFQLEGRTRGNTKPIVEWGAGMVNATLNQHAYELAGHLQFTPQAGIGIEHFVSPGRAFVLEYRFLHISNDGIQEPNHGVHSSVLSIGFRWSRRPNASSLR